MARMSVCAAFDNAPSPLPLLASAEGGGGAAAIATGASGAAPGALRSCKPAVGVAVLMVPLACGGAHSAPSA
jgi:hypothetical protein